MLTTSLEKIDKFYIVLTVVLVFMAVMVIFSFKGVFSAFLTAYDFDQKSVGEEVRLDSDKLDEAYSYVFDRSVGNLQIRD